MRISEASSFLSRKEQSAYLSGYAKNSVHQLLHYVEQVKPDAQRHEEYYRIQVCWQRKAEHACNERERRGSDCHDGHAYERLHRAVYHIQERRENRDHQQKLRRVERSDHAFKDHDIIFTIVDIKILRKRR